jgi:phosphate transport system substrate-binding protein
MKMLRLVGVITAFSIQWLNAQNNQKIIISGTRFTYPLVERWIAEYTKLHPEATLKINPRGGANADSANLIINAHELEPKDVRPGYKTTNFASYALLPVANANISIANDLKKVGIREKELVSLFFDKWDPSEDEKEKKNKKKYKNAPKIQLYTRQQSACAPITFAKHFDHEQKDLLGKGIGGDDKHLIDAVLKDSSGVTYNNLGFIYDLKTRKQREGLIVIPIDANSNGTVDEEEKIYDDLDKLIAGLEAKKNDDIVVGNINISFPEKIDASNKQYVEFVNWVLTDGQSYLHEYGFLNLTKNDLSKQKDLFNLYAKN